MNKIYKVIWNKTRGMYMVVSELAKGQSKDGRRAVGRKKVAQTAAALAVFFSIVSMGGTSFAADTGITKVESSTSDTAVEVYTKAGTDSQIDAAKKYTYRKAAELDTRITNVKEYLEKQTSENYVSKTDAAVQNGAIVKANKTIGDNVTKLDAALASETAARIGADKAQDKVIQTVNDNLVQSVTTINKNVADGFNALNTADANEAKARTDADAAEKAAREAGDTALNTRITNVKEYLEQQTSDKYVSKADAAVQDGAIVKANKTIGENVTNLDAALAKETAARIGADKAQDKVIQTVNDNLVQSVNTINQNMAAGFNALSQADANELAGRVAADTELAKAVNNGLSLDQDNVLQKNTTSVGEDGTVTTSKEAATTLVMNKDGNNQITLSENGIKVGLNSTVQDANGFYAGGDNAEAANAALNADGSIKGANGAFAVDTSGNVTSGNVTSTGTVQGTTLTDGKGASMSNGVVTGKTLTDGTASLSNGNLTGAHNITADGTITGATLTDGIATITNGNINTSGTITGGTVTSTGNISAVGDIHAGGAITGASASIQGALTAGSATITGDLTAGGAIQGKSISDGTATMQNGNLTGVKNLSAETITTSGDATIGGDLTVNGKLNVDEIDLTKNGIVGDNNVTASTRVAAGEITSYKKATSTKDGSEKESAIDYDENGTSTWAKATDADGNWNKSTLTVEGSDVTSKVIDSEKNSNLATQSAKESSSVLSDKDSNNTSSFRQRINQILQEIKSANGSTSVEQNDVNITNTAANGTITNDAKALVNKASDSITSQIGDGSAVKSIMDANGIANTATGGTISNSAANISNTTTGNMTNTVGGNLIDTIMGTSTTTVTGKVTEDYKSDLSTKVGGDETHAVTGNQTTTVSGNRTVNVKGTETENFNALETNVKTAQKTSVGGNQTTIVTGNQTNNVSGSKTETVKGSVTEKYGSQATTVDGDQSTNIGGNQTTVVAKDQTNTVSGNKTETVKGAVNETYGSQTTKVNGDQSTTVTGKQTNSITGDQVNTIGGSQTTTVTGDVTEDYKANLSTTVGGNQTTTVTGDSSLTAENITNKATKKLFNAAAEIENSASTSITDKVGDNVERTMTTKKISESVKDGTKSNSFSKTAEKDINIITDGTDTSTLSQLADSVNTSLKNGTQSLNNTKTVTEDVTKVTDKNTGAFSSSSQKADAMTNTVKNGSKSNTVTETASTSEQKLVSGNIIDILKNAEKGYVNTIVSNSDGSSSTGVEQTYTDITSTAGNRIQDKVGTTTVTTTDGLTKLTNEAGNHKTQMDYAEVLKDLGVKGNATIDKDLSVGGSATVAGDVTAKSYKVGDKTYIDENGINGNGQKVTNVADGTIAEGSTDAVNGGQLHQTNQRVATVENRMDGVENRMDRVETRVDNLDNRIDKVGASAAAMANLHPMDFDEDSKVSVAAAVGSYRSETAGALGVFYRPTDRVMMNVSTSFGNGENMIGGGVSFKLGKSSKRLEKAEATNAALAKQVTNLQNRLDALLGVLNPSLSKDFPDVPANHWAYEAVSRLAGNDIIQGYEDGKYHGERTMTRYEMAEIIYNALSKGAKAEAKLVEEFRPELQAMAAQRKA